MTLDETADLNRLLAEQRPRLHRYCARMLGSSIEGEDVVQEALVKAAEAFPAAGPLARPESWLFRIAHNCALDALRRRRRQAGLRDEDALDQIPDPSAAADARVRASASLAGFMRLSPAQRSSVLLADVLGYSLVETGEILGASLPAVKAALHRGRLGLKQAAAMPDAPLPRLAEAERTRLQAYADRFNAHDFDALRDLLAEDVRLDLVNRLHLAGRKDVAAYFGRYIDHSSGWRLAPALAEGRPALTVHDPENAGGPTDYVVLLDWRDDRIAAIRDFRFAAYAMEEMEVRSL